MMDNMDIYTQVVCPVCGHQTYDNYWICDHCGWEYDGHLLDEDYSSANGCTLQEYKASIKDVSKGE